jgi:hypothetical protein
VVASGHQVVDHFIQLLKNTWWPPSAILFENETKWDLVATMCQFQRFEIGIWWPSSVILFED